MMSLKSVWNRWTTDSSVPPQRDTQTLVCESLMGELDYQIKEFERIERESEQEDKRKKTGVDYSWLVSAQKPSYEIPQLERLDLEGLCYRVKPSESSRVLTLFRDALYNEPRACELSRIMRACINQVLEQRPKEETITDWVARRSQSLTSLRIRPNTRVSPGQYQDPENPQSPDQTRVEQFRSISLPEYTGTDVKSLPV